MTKFYVVYETEGWYDGEYGKIDGLFDDREKALKFLDYQVRLFKEEQNNVDLVQKYDTETESVRRFNNGEYYDWDTCDTSHYSFRMQVVELSPEVIIKNKGGI